MAVVPGGNFGNYFNQYHMLTDARNWNTKNYDYATVKNKGEISEDAKNENPNATAAPETYGTALVVKANKNGYILNGKFFEDNGNPTYQVRDKYDRIDNNYYVNQQTGDVYFRPRTVGTTGSESITFPTGTVTDEITPQYFGTSFNLNKVPNPEEFGTSALNKLAVAISSVNGGEYGEIIVNGVTIASSGLDTSSKPAIPVLPSDALYSFSNSFTAGSENFTPVRPETKWKAAYQQWVGAGGSLGAGTAANPTITNEEAMWYPDLTDSQYNPSAPGPNGETDFLFRKKFTVGETVPADPVYLNIGAADNYQLFINGNLVTSGSWPNSQHFNIQPYLVPGENVIGIHASDGDYDEGMYVQMPPESVEELGFDLSVSAGGWEAARGGLNPDDPAGISHTFTDQWTYETPSAVNSNNGRYTNSEPGRVFRQSYFNNRTTDNFILKSSLAFLDTSSGSPGKDWAGFQLRTNSPNDLPTDSGYTVAISQDGNVVLYKAHVDINPPVTDPISGGTSNEIVASGTTSAFTVNPNGSGAKNIEIHANGTNIKVLVNGATAIDYTDNTGHAYTDGYTTLSTYGPYVAYDDFQLYSYTPEIQLLSRALRQGENNIVIKGYDDSLLTVNVSNDSKIGNVALGTNNILPDLATTDIMDPKYKASSRVDIAHPDANELDPNKAYWSVSQKSALGIAGKIVFQNREGGSLQKVRDQFSRVNTVMEDMTSLLGSTDDLYKSHLNLIR